MQKITKTKKKVKKPSIGDAINPSRNNNTTLNSPKAKNSMMNSPTTKSKNANIELLANPTSNRMIATMRNKTTERIEKKKTPFGDDSGSKL